ncbi:MAG: type II toxin-antitoxin system mRNA interferase toxin, RelE/StbE family [Armatimonadetes bacterium CG_4_9_14_3_um_filter_58_7]|nr:MAG: type II toxin-antitoxin system mRNA interferase toxin, RelE/StbE family [Armatimonadetes bacterium CG_4_9_14_3_um_filter_58_7]
MHAAKVVPSKTTCGSGANVQHPYRVDNASSRVEKQLNVLPDTHFEAVVAAIKDLGANPRPPGCRKLGGDTYRVRVGSYRVIYTVHDISRRVVIDKVARRSEKPYRRR